MYQLVCTVPKCISYFLTLVIYSVYLSHYSKVLTICITETPIFVQRIYMFSTIFRIIGDLFS